MIPLFKPSCSELEIENVNRVLRSGWWGCGPETEQFEEEFARYIGVNHAIAVSSGTMALELAARAMDHTRSEIVVPALTFVSTAQAMLHAGKGNRILFADVNEDTLTIDWQHADSLAGDLIVPVWYGGTVTDAPSYGIDVLEDCAHAAGSKRAGTQGLCAAWSFQAVKNLSTGDGGMVTTDDADIAARLRRLRWCGIDRSTWDRDKDKKVGYGWEYQIPEDGEKGYMNDITAAIGRAQLQRLPEMNAARCQIAEIYNHELSMLDWCRTPTVVKQSSNHMYVLRVPPISRTRFIEHMLSQGVSAGVHYKPLTRYPNLGWETPALPVTDRVWPTLVTLPLYPDMKVGEVVKVVDAVRSFQP